MRIHILVVISLGEGAKLGCKPLAAGTLVTSACNFYRIGLEVSLLNMGMLALFYREASLAYSHPRASQNTFHLPSNNTIIKSTPTTTPEPTPKSPTPPQRGSAQGRARQGGTAPTNNTKKEPHPTMRKWSPSCLPPQ